MPRETQCTERTTQHNTLELRKIAAHRGHVYTARQHPNWQGKAGGGDIRLQPSLHPPRQQCRKQQHPAYLPRILTPSTDHTIDDQGHFIHTPCMCMTWYWRWKNSCGKPSPTLCCGLAREPYVPEFLSCNGKTSLLCEPLVNTPHEQGVRVRVSEKLPCKFSRK